jgi:hypothetical protein
VHTRLAIFLFRHCWRRSPGPGPGSMPSFSACNYNFIYKSIFSRIDDVSWGSCYQCDLIVLAHWAISYFALMYLDVGRTWFYGLGSGFGFILWAKTFTGLKTLLNKLGLHWDWALALLNKIKFGLDPVPYPPLFALFFEDYRSGRNFWKTFLRG